MTHSPALVNPSKIALVIPTRGDVDLGPIMETVPAGWQTVVWDNSVQEDLGVYGRYAAIDQTEAEVIMTQDDDCLVDLERVAAAYEPGRLVANMPRSRWADYPDSALVGWGSVFDRDLPARAFGRLIPDFAEMPRDDFHRVCDVAFSALTPRTVIDFGFTHLPWAETDGRMFRQPGHKRERDAMLEACRQVRGWPDDDVRLAA